jgi:hypothetical protein
LQTLNYKKIYQTNSKNKKSGCYVYYSVGLTESPP